MPSRGWDWSAMRQDDTLGPQKRLLQSLGDEDKAFSLVTEARGEFPGTPDARLSSLSPNDLALLDRLASGQQARARLGWPMAAAGGLVGIAPYEILKGISQGLGTSGLMSFAGRFTGDPSHNAENYQLGPSTSDASLDNVAAYFEGIRGREAPPKPAAHTPAMPAFNMAREALARAYGFR